MTTEKKIDWDSLADERPTAATVDWDRFLRIVSGKILDFQDLRKIFKNCGGVSDANLRRKIYSLRRQKKVAIRYTTVGSKVRAYYRFE